MIGFTDDQRKALVAKLDPAHVRTREQGGQPLSYIEGWHAIAEANRIFGHDAWDRETVWVNCVWSGERQTRKGAKPAASYVARVRVTVRAGDQTIVREGTGAGSGFGQDHGEAHESAIKEAETDAMKRALMTFGNPFGLALYDKEKANVGVERPAAEPISAAAIKSLEAEIQDELGMAPDLDALNAMWKRHKARLATVKAQDEAAYAKIAAMFAQQKQVLLAQPNTVLAAE